MRYMHSIDIHFQTAVCRRNMIAQNGKCYVKHVLLAHMAKETIMFHLTPQGVIKVHKRGTSGTVVLTMNSPSIPSYVMLGNIMLVTHKLRRIPRRVSPYLTRI